jgi:uncharacterized protein YuzB (UPF0349 family)
MSPLVDHARVTSYIQCCLDNVDATTRSRVQAGGTTVDATVQFRPCLQRCGTCYEGSFLIIDGDLRRGESHEGLLADLARADGTDTGSDLATDCTDVTTSVAEEQISCPGAAGRDGADSW